MSFSFRSSPSPMAADKDSMAKSNGCSWDSMLPGPPSRNNFGSIDLSPSGLLAFSSGAAVTVLDSHSVQLIATIPLPPPPMAQPSSSPSLSPFVTSVRWMPFNFRSALLSVEPSSSHLVLAAADRHGRIALLDLRLKTVILWIEPDPSPRAGVQDLAWVLFHSESYALAAISGPSTVSLYSTAALGRCFFKYDASPEMLSCIRCDPFDARRFCVVGLKGFLLSLKLLGEGENDVVLKEMHIPTDRSELLRLEKDANVNGSSSLSAPASAVFPTYCVRFAFSPLWRHIIFVTFPRELVVFDLQYEAVLFTTGLPRGCARFMDVLPDPNNDLLYCIHFDGKLSLWRRKKGEQVHILCAVEELMPSLGTSVPSPSILAFTIDHSESTLQHVAKLYSMKPDSPMENFDIDNPFDFGDDTLLLSKTHFVSISDDGKVWNWLLTAEGADELLKGEIDINTNSNLSEDTNEPSFANEGALQEHLGSRRGKRLTITNPDDVSFKLSLVGQLQLLSSTVTTLAVASPSMMATLARGGNYPAIAVPLVALGTQNGSIDIVDVSANAVAVSYSVHNGSIRGLRWLGNSRIVSFSCNQANEKTGGYVNKLVVTCVRTGLNKPFRVLQKPERSNIRALRTSSSGRYLLILFRDAPVEVWAMTKNPIMLRSLALPFTVLEWTLPSVPRPGNKGFSKEQEAVASPKASVSDSQSASSDASPDDSSESFAFALGNGALGVFEVHGRRIRDYRPKWPSSSFVSTDGLITAMAFRIPHVVMGDQSGNIRWWDITTGHSSSFNTYREGIRRIKFSPYVIGDRSRGRIAVLFNDNTFSVFDLDSPDPLANSLLQPQSPGTLVLELDWLPVRIDKNDPLVLCLAGADSSFRIIQVQINEKRAASGMELLKERFRPIPICSPLLLPTPHALALRTILQLGVKPSWFNTCSITIDKRPHSIPDTVSPTTDLRSYIIEIPGIGDSAVPEMLLKILESYRKEGCILDDEQARLYATVLKKGPAARFAFAAAVFGETCEAFFWLQLNDALNHFVKKRATKPFKSAAASTYVLPPDDVVNVNGIPTEDSSAEVDGRESLGEGQHTMTSFWPEEIRESANEQISWHQNLEGEEAIQNRVHELISVGNLDAAVSLLLSTSPESSYFYPNALRAVALSSAVSKSLHELAVKVVAANMVRSDRSLSGTHLLCAVGRYQEACSQLQDAGCWTDAATLASTHLKGSDYARVLQRWADHMFRVEHNIWRALILYVSVGAFQEALMILRQTDKADTAALLILACSEFQSSSSNFLSLPPDDVLTVRELYAQFQRKLVHLCMDAAPFSD